MLCILLFKFKILLADVEFPVFSRLVSRVGFDEVPDGDDVLVFKPVYFVVDKHKVNVCLRLSPKNRMVVFVSWCSRNWFSIRCLSRRLAWLIDGVGLRLFPWLEPQTLQI